MSKNIIKAIMLGVLIITCIVQTAILWLGGVSGHNFLGKENSVAVPLEPETIWINTVTFGYPINDRKREYNQLVTELSNLLALYKKEIKLEEVPTYSWEDILKEPGIIYEYSIPVSLQEIAGTSVTANLDMSVKHLVLTIPVTSTNKITIYMVEDVSNKVYEVNLFGKIDTLAKIQDAFAKEEVTRNRIAYQASALTSLKGYINGNVFLSLNSKDSPLTYNVLKVKNPIEADKTKKIERLEGCVNSLFANPLTKEIQEKEDGTVIFTEYRKGVVTYRPTGVIEYVNSNKTTVSSGMDRLEGYKAVTYFLENTDIINKKVKNNLYISNIIQNDDEYTYYFDMKYKDYKINMSEKLKKELDVKATVELTVKNHQITKGKWLALEIFPVYEGNGYRVEGLKEAYAAPVDAMYKAGIIKPQANYMKLQDLECVYAVESIKQNVHMRWAGRSNNKWYYP